MKTKLRYTDSSLYWRQRANRPGQKSVMWRNEFYNILFREEQRKILETLFSDNKDQPFEILEYGCGIGIVCRILVDIFPNAHVTGIDFQEMISVAQRNNSHPRITYIVCEAENFIDCASSYDLIISSGCITSITNINYVYTILQNIIHMLTPKGKILFIDPFHKYWPLTRKSIYIEEVIEKFEKAGIKMILYSGISFWPVRMLIANSPYSKKQLHYGFIVEKNYYILWEQSFGVITKFYYLVVTKCNYPWLKIYFII